MAQPDDDDTHECPGPGCRRRVPSHLLTCGACWWKVPPAIREAVNRTWRGGHGAGGAAHREAIRAAMNALARRG